MGSFFGGKKKAEEPAASAVKDGSGTKPSVTPRQTASSPTNRPSRRSVVPGAATMAQQKAVVAAKAAARPPAPVAPAARPVAAPAAQPVEDAAFAPSEARAHHTSAISASSAPQFTGSLSANAAKRTGPVRTGDAALKDFVVNKAKLATADAAEAAAAKAAQDGIPFDAALVAGGAFTEEQLVNALTSECWVPHLRVEKYQIRKKALDTVSREDAQHYGVLPVDKLGSLLTLAMVNPLDQDTINAIESKTGLDVKRSVATRTEIQQGIDKYYSGTAVAQDVTLSFTADANQEERSLTQMLANVKTSEAPASASNTQNITAEILDIDDLLSADDIIAPAIVEPMKLAEGELPLIVPADQVVDLNGDSPALEARKPSTISDSLPFISNPEIFVEPPPAAAQSGTSGRQVTVVTMIPVLEDEFRHAISHGKAHVFEKWVGLQARNNRVVNALPIDTEVEELLGIAASRN